MCLQCQSFITFSFQLCSLLGYLVMRQMANTKQKIVLSRQTATGRISISALKSTTSFRWLLCVPATMRHINIVSTDVYIQTSKHVVYLCNLEAYVHLTAALTGSQSLDLVATTQCLANVSEVITIITIWLRLNRNSCESEFDYCIYYYIVYK